MYLKVLKDAPAEKKRRKKEKGVDVVEYKIRNICNSNENEAQQRVIASLHPSLPFLDVVVVFSSTHEPSLPI
jgi:hypothetical protein